MPILTTDFGGTDSGNSLTRLSDGKLLFAGNSLLSGGNYVFALARYNADGTLDTTFDGDGKVTTDFTDNINGIENGKCVTVQADGKILVAGECEGDFAIVRYNTDGSLDTTFSNDGKACYHSHNYSVIEEFRRYFDIGVFHSRESWFIQKMGKPEGEGKKFVISELRYLLKRAPWVVPSAAVRTGMKLVGYKMGIREQIMPSSLKLKLSMNKGYWRVHPSN